MKPDEVFIQALIDQRLDIVDIRMIISTLRALGYINEMQYSRMNTALTETSSVIVRSDGSETIELARERILPKEH